MTIFLHLALSNSEFYGLLGLTLDKSLLLLPVYLSKISVFILIVLCFFMLVATCDVACWSGWLEFNCISYCFHTI